MSNILKVLLLSICATNSYAVCTASMPEVSFGDVLLRSAPEFSTSGIISLRCDQADLKKTLTLSFDKDYIAHGTQKIPVYISIRNAPMPPTQTYTAPISVQDISIPVEFRIMSRDIPANTSVGAYSSNVILLYKYE